MVLPAVEFDTRVLGTDTYDVAVTSMANNVLTAAAINADAITAAKVASDVTTEIQAGLATASALATLSGYVDTEVASILTAVDTEIASILTAVGTNIPATLTTIEGKIDTIDNFVDTEIGTIITAVGTTIPNAIAALNDLSVADILAGGNVDGFTVEETLKLVLAVLTGKLISTATTATFRAADDSKDRVTATVSLDGDRSAVTLDET